MSHDHLETWDVDNFGWRVRHNNNYNSDWISSHQLHQDPRSLELLQQENLDISDSSPHEVGWLQNINRLVDMMPSSFDPSDYQLIDIGCGSGISTLYIALNYPFTSCLGIDFSPTLIEAAHENKRILGKEDEVAFIVADARSFRINVSQQKLFLFLFNPFGYQTASQFFANNISALRERSAVVAFACDTWIHQFASANLHRQIIRNAYYKLSVIFF
jgi:SAM-dependent methyltransferase